MRFLRRFWNMLGRNSQKSRGTSSGHHQGGPSGGPHPGPPSRT